MEALTKHEFRATADDELSFTKGIKIKILSTEEDKNWYKAEYQGHEGYVPSNYIELVYPPWYMTDITRGDAETILLERSDRGQFIHRDGAFLVRPSESMPGEFSISVKFADQVQHFKVLRDGAGKYFLWVVKFDSLNELVNYHRTASVSRSQTIYLQEMTRQKVIANYDYQTQDDQELSLRRGDIVTVLEKKDPNWWMGEVIRDNRTVRGLFPKTYVTPYTN